jgi:hypothetical protein
MSSDDDYVIITDRERELITTGLLARICFIETGTMGLRATDVEGMGDAKPTGFTGRVKALSSSQMQIILDSEAVIAKLRRK